MPAQLALPSATCNGEPSGKPWEGSNRLVASGALEVKRTIKQRPPSSYCRFGYSYLELAGRLLPKSHLHRVLLHDLPENLLLLYQQMKLSGLEEKFARRLVMEAHRAMDEADIENYAYVKIFLARMLMKKGIEPLIKDYESLTKTI